MIHNEVVLSKTELILGQDRKQWTMKMVGKPKVENILTQETLLMVDEFDKVASFTMWMGKLVLFQCGSYENIMLKFKGLVIYKIHFLKECFITHSYKLPHKYILVKRKWVQQKLNTIAWNENSTLYFINGYMYLLNRVMYKL